MAHDDFFAPTAPYVGTMHHVVEAMLRNVGLQPDELHVDLGAGDGRIVLAAARDFGARSTGIERDPALVQQARDAIAAAGCEDRGSIVEGDMCEVDLSSADVVTLFLNTHSNALIAPKLAQELKPGARIVSYLFPLAGWQPYNSLLDPPGHRLHIYHIPTSLPVE